jgi:[ribosomal protein S18]-alanine N-acetyltransferase
MPDFFLVAKRHRTVVSYVAASVHGSTAEIVSIAVDPKHQGHGIGKALITHMLARLKASAIRRVALTVRPENRPAMRLYSTLGFHRVRRINRDYSDGSDAFEMQIVLSTAMRTADATIPSRTST